MGKANAKRPASKKSNDDIPEWAHRLTMALDVKDVKDKASRTMLGNKIGVSYKTIESWSNGRTEPKFRQLIQLATFCETTVEWILEARGEGPSLSGYRPALRAASSRSRRSKRS
jgi:DNA-binding XRE family transcriptional regulator